MKIIRTEPLHIQKDSRYLGSPISFMYPRQQSWKKSNVQVFWGEVAHCSHVVQIYQNDDVLLNTLEGFVSTGILGRECVIVAATAFHLASLEARLVVQGFDLEVLKAEDRLILIDAEKGLAEFMVDGLPDAQLFRDLSSVVMNRALATGRKIRAFGEMVGVLVAQGNSEAAIEIEHFWNEIHDKSSSIFCAYKASSFPRDADQTIDSICKAHTRLIDGYPRPATVMYHRPV